jgi:hypothetical protein
MYFNCVEGCNEILSQCLKIYKDVENNPAINQWHKIAALRLAREVQNHKFRMFQNGPEIGTLHEKVEELRRFASEDRSDTFIKRGDSLPLFSPSSSPYKDFNVRDLDKP